MNPEPWAELPSCCWRWRCSCASSVAHGKRVVHVRESHEAVGTGPGPCRTRYHGPALSGCGEPRYTFGPPLRTPDIKNFGKDLAPEELRICPWAVGTRKFSGFSGAITSKSLKKSRCARPDDQLHDRYRDFAMCDEKSEDPAKMTHSISDFLRRLRA